MLESFWTQIWALSSAGVRSRPAAAGCRWRSGPPAWGCSWRRPGTAWTCRWCWRRAQRRRPCWTGRSAGTAPGPAALWPAAAPALPWNTAIRLSTEQKRRARPEPGGWRQLLPECFYFGLGLFTHPDLIAGSSFSLLRLSGQTSHPSWSDSLNINSDLLHTKQ